MTIAEIKNYIKKEKITQIELSEKSGIPLQTLRKIFSGIVKNPRVDTMHAIERALNISEHKNNQKNLSEDEKRLLNAYRSIQVDKKDIYLEIIEQAAEKSKQQKLI